MADLILPEGVSELIEQQPLIDVALAVFRRGLPGMKIRSRIPGEPQTWPTEESPLIVVRRASTPGTWRGDPRFTNFGHIAVHVFAFGQDADEVAAHVSEATRVVLRNAWREQWVFPGIGSLARIWIAEDPVRKADWATATGPVQYADLPTGWERYESRYALEVRLPLP